MKVRYLFLLSLLFLVPDLEAQEQYMLSESYSNLSFYDFVIKAEKSFDIKFFYRKDWVKDLKVGDYPQCTTLSCLLTNLFQGTSLHFLIEESGNIVITNNYAIKVTSVPVEKDAVFLPPTDYLSSEETLQTGNTYVEVGNPAEKNNPGDVIVSGYITNKDTKEPVSGVTVFEKKLATGTISNEYGYYTLNIPRGVHQLRFSFIGMREKPINLNLYGAGELDVEMNSVLIPLKETIISAQKSITLQRFEVGVEKININSFHISPTSLGESDIIKNVLLIPGVQSVGEGSTGFNVRGGSADQNLILLYGSPVYNSSHFFGFFSAVNSDIIKDVTLYKGGIPARYGGRISSVLDIGTRMATGKNLREVPVSVPLQLI